mgnify:CR=1 FL=1
MPRVSRRGVPGGKAPGSAGTRAARTEDAPASAATADVQARLDVTRGDTLINDTRQLLRHIERSASAQSPGRDLDVGYENSVAFSLLRAHWERVYRVSAAAFAAGFRTAVERAVLERTGRPPSPP